MTGRFIRSRLTRVQYQSAEEDGDENEEEKEEGKGKHFLGSGADSSATNFESRR